MALKYLLVALSTNRMDDDGAEQRVRFRAKSVVDLTEQELEDLDKLTAVTGKLHYRDPITEGRGTVTASAPEVITVPDYAGQDVAMDKKTVDQLKAYLSFHEIAFDNGATKADLLKLATKPADVDGGL